MEKIRTNTHQLPFLVQVQVLIICQEMEATTRILRCFGMLIRRRCCINILLVFVPGLLVGLNLRLVTMPIPEPGSLSFPRKEIDIPSPPLSSSQQIRHGHGYSSIYNPSTGTATLSMLSIIDNLINRLQTEWNEMITSTNGKSSRHLANFYCIGTNRSIIERSLVLATHLSVDRIQDRVPLLLEFWNGPASIAIYLYDSNQIIQLSQHLKNLSFQAQNCILGGDTILHFYMESNAPKSYPHNILRNLAMLHNFGTDIQQDWVLSLDADFIPTWNTHLLLLPMLLHHWNSSISNDLPNKVAFVLPVFNIVPPSGTWTSLDGTTTKWIPKTRSELIHLYQQNISQEWPYKAGHQSNNYSLWLTNDKNNVISYPITPSKGYEPYFVAQRHLLPNYWEAFRGFGLDKQSFVAQVILEGFQFQVLRDFYVVHISHPSNRNDIERELNIIEWQKHFKPYLKEHYDGRNNVSQRQKRFFNIPFLQE